MQALITFAMAFVLASFAGHARACAAPERDKPYDERLAYQLDARRRADHIILARVVEIDFPNGPSELFHQSVVSLTEDRVRNSLVPVTSSSCGPFWKPGDLALIYYRRVQVRESATSRDFWIESRPLSIVDVRANVDPEIGPMLREAARRESNRAQLLR